MNIIVVMLDSLRQDHVSFYGWDGCPVETPHLDAFASEAVAFDNCYPQGLPTVLVLLVFQPVLLCMQLQLLCLAEVQLFQLLVNFVQLP